MKWAKALIFGEKFTVCMVWRFCLPLRFVTAFVIQVLLSSYGRKDSRLTKRICSIFWIDEGETMNYVPLTQQLRLSPSSMAFERNSPTRGSHTFPKPVKSGVQVLSLNTSGMKVQVSDSRFTSFSTMITTSL